MTHSVPLSQLPTGPLSWRGTAVTLRLSLPHWRGAGPVAAQHSRRGTKALSLWHCHWYVALSLWATALVRGLRRRRRWHGAAAASLLGLLLGWV